MSPFDVQAEADFENCFDHFKETVIRRIGGSATVTEPVLAVVEIDNQPSGVPTDGLIDNPERGQWSEYGANLEVAANQAESPQDAWVIRSVVWQQDGSAKGADGGSKTLKLVRRVHLKGRKPNIAANR